MSKLPDFPDAARLSKLSPSLHRLVADTYLWRVYPRGGNHPREWNQFRYFGPLNSRFDHHLANADDKPHQQERGILYLAGNMETALAEFFQDIRIVDRRNRTPYLVEIQITNDLSLLDLTGRFCIKAGASMELISSGLRGITRNWSRGFYDHYSDIHGLYYNSSLTNEPVIALYERALGVNPLPKTPNLDLALNDPSLQDMLSQACAEIGYDFV